LDYSAEASPYRQIDWCDLVATVHGILYHTTTARDSTGTRVDKLNGPHPTCPINSMDFQHVPPVGIEVRSLSLSIAPGKSVTDFLPTWGTPPPKPVELILKDVSMEIPRGTLMAIIGASGSGKVNYRGKAGANVDFVIEFDCEADGSDGEDASCWTRGLQRGGIEGCNTRVCDSTGYFVTYCAVGGVRLTG
jgi:hypothetical protein